eukprot:12597738-Ditylum_brightwellii.AAC.1
MSRVHLGNWIENYLMSLRWQHTQAVSHKGARHTMHTGLVEHTGPARQLKLPKRRMRPGQWHMKPPKGEKCGLTDESG